MKARLAYPMRNTTFFLSAKKSTIPLRCCVVDGFSEINLQRIQRSSPEASTDHFNAS